MLLITVHFDKVYDSKVSFGYRESYNPSYVGTGLIYCRYVIKIVATVGNDYEYDNIQLSKMAWETNACPIRKGMKNYTPGLDYPCKLLSLLVFMPYLATNKHFQSLWTQT